MFAIRCSRSQLACGFTLIEHLVVISIIALLIAILLPALQSARSSARAIVCQSNQRQLGIVLYTYVGDNREYLPGAAKGSSEYWTAELIRGGYYPEGQGGPALYGGVRWPINTLQETFLHCPSYGEARYSSPGYSEDHEFYTVAYGVPRGTIGRRDNTQAELESAKSRIDDFHRQSSTMTAFDAFTRSSNPYEGNQQVANMNDLYIRHSPRHNGGANYLFLDGHVQSFMFDEVEAHMIPFSTGRSRNPGES